MDKIVWFMFLVCIMYSVTMIYAEEKTHDNINLNYGCDNSTINWGYPISTTTCDMVENWSEAKQLSWAQSQANVDAHFYSLRPTGLFLLMTICILFLRWNYVTRSS